MSDKSEIEAIRTVKRYTQPCVQQQLGPEFKVAEVPLFESAKGKYVLFTDYAVLLSHLDEQAKRIAALESGMDAVQAKLAECLQRLLERRTLPNRWVGEINDIVQSARATLAEVKP